MGMNVGKYEIPILKVILGSKFKKFKKLGKKTGKSTKHSRDMYLWQRYINTYQRCRIKRIHNSIRSMKIYSWKHNGKYKQWGTKRVHLD